MRDLVKLINRKQQPGETFNGFYIALKQAAEDGGVNNCQQCHDRLIITLITSGICDAETKKKLLALRPFPELTSSRSAARKKPWKRTGMHSRALVQTRFPPTGADHVTGCSPTSRHLTGTEPPRLARGAETAATTSQGAQTSVKPTSARPTTRPAPSARSHTTSPRSASPVGPNRETRRQSQTGSTSATSAVREAPPST